MRIFDGNKTAKNFPEYMNIFANLSGTELSVPSLNAK
jgi:hypothetical protein